MTDPLAIAALGFTIEKAGGRELLVRLLGPTFDYFGQSTSSLAEKGVLNIGRIFHYATKKLGDRLEQPGTIPPRVLQAVVTEGAFCEDELMAEYFGGILAASRGKEFNDQGVTFTKMLGAMSALQIKAHYLFYASCRAAIEQEKMGNMKLGTADQRLILQTYIPGSALIQFMPEVTQASQIPHIMFGLARQTLIAENWQVYGPETIKTQHPELPEAGVVFTPSGLGIELFLWAHGHASAQLHAFANLDIQFKTIQDLPLPKGIKRIGA